MLRSLLPISSVALFVLFFSGKHEPLQNNNWKQAYQSRDQLLGYLEKLYDLVDEQPYYFANKADSIETTLWRSPKSKSEKLAYLDFVLSIAYYLLQQGQIQASTRWYEKGLNYQQQQKIAYEAEEFIVKPLGNNYVRLGNYDKAIAIQQAAIELATKEKKTNLLSSLYCNQGIAYYWLNNFEATQTACNNGLLFVAQNATVAGILYNVKADAFFASSNIDSAFWYNQKALMFFRSSEAVNADASWMVNALQLSAKLLFRQKKWVKALQKFHNAELLLHQAFPNTRQRDKAKLKVEKGELFFQLHQLDSSRRNFKEGLLYFDIDKQGYFPDNTVTSLYAGLAKSFVQTLPDSAAFYYQLAVSNDYYCSQLITVTANTLQKNSSNLISEEAISFFEEQYTKTNNQEIAQQMLWLIEISKGRNLLNEQSRSKLWLVDSSGLLQQQLFTELRNNYLILAETNDEVKKEIISNRIREQELHLGLKENRFAQLIEQPSFEKFKKRLIEVTEQADFISYSNINSKLLCLKTTGGVVSCKKILANSKSLIDSFLNTYFVSSSTAFNNNPEAYFRMSNEVRKHILSGVIVQRPLIISADGWVHNLSFEALSTDGKQTFLAEKVPVSYVYTFMQYVKVEKDATHDLRLTVYTFGNSQNKFPALPNSIVEGKFLRSSFNTQCFDAAETDANFFVASLQSKNLMHIATHAVADTLQQPFLVLKNKFYLDQLQYVVTSAPLVVLTACEAATGKMQNNEGLTSIGRAFVSKGVKGVIASRWPVDDEFVPVFVNSFYAALQKKKSPSMALYLARKKYLQQTNSLAQKNPLLWAGFCYTGVWQQLHIQSSGFHYYWAILLLAAVVLFLLFRKYCS